MSDATRAGVVAVLMLLLAPAAAWAQPSRADRAVVPVPVTGRTLHLALGGGERVSGELIEVDDAALLLWGDGGPRRLALEDVRSASYERHGFGLDQAVLWVGLGALVSGLGLSHACSQVEDTECGGVFPAVALSWVIIGGAFAGTMAAGRTQGLPVDASSLRPYARFPQGAPAGFREGASSVPQRPPGILPSKR